MTKNHTPIISIITATYNASNDLPKLIESLLTQTDQDFEWVIADGMSTDATLDNLRQVKDSLKRVVISSQLDFGIYDALNRGVRLASGSYYLVLGADDTLAPDAIANYKQAIARSGADLVTAHVLAGGKRRGVRTKPWVWLHGSFAAVSSHAVGLAIRRTLHDELGYYSHRYPIAADQLFIQRALRRGATVSQEPFLAGHFNASSGASSRDILGTLAEGFRIQVETGQSIFLQSLVFLARVIKNIRSIKKNHADPGGPR